MPFRAQIIERQISDLKPFARNARTHSIKQIKQIARSIERFGFTNPVLISEASEIIAGHGRVQAAKLLGLTSVPTIALSHLTDEERRAYVLADNKLALNAGWDREILAIELQALVDLNFDVEVTGFSLAEIDFAIDELGESDPDGSDTPDDFIPAMSGPAITQSGDLWQMGRHRLLCGDAQDPEVFRKLLDGEKANLVFTDPPYNVAIDGNVCGFTGEQYADDQPYPRHGGGAGSTECHRHQAGPCPATGHGSDARDPQATLSRRCPRASRQGRAH
jgi:hypothetical protein